MSVEFETMPQAITRVDHREYDRDGKLHKKGREVVEVVDVYETEDQALTLSVSREPTDNVEISQIRGSHYLVRGDVKDLTAVATPDPTAKKTYILDYEGKATNISPMGAVDVFDIKNKKIMPGIHID